MAEIFDIETIMRNEFGNELVNKANELHTYDSIHAQQMVFFLYAKHFHGDKSLNLNLLKEFERSNFTTLNYLATSEKFDTKFCARMLLEFYVDSFVDQKLPPISHKEYEPVSWILGKEKGDISTRLMDSIVHKNYFARKPKTKVKENILSMLKRIETIADVMHNKYFLLREPKMTQEHESTLQEFEEKFPEENLAYISRVMYNIFCFRTINGHMPWQGSTTLEGVYLDASDKTSVKRIERNLRTDPDLALWYDINEAPEPVAVNAENGKLEFKFHPDERATIKLSLNSLGDASYRLDFDARRRCNNQSIRHVKDFHYKDLVRSIEIIETIGKEAYSQKEGSQFCRC
ncbi:MAG: hypothetical protein Q8O89_03595 [Nanoarchaeota archaeon]|nr:hypothetical protein [Nanoarchaeota archaeon]